MKASRCSGRGRPGRREGDDGVSLRMGIVSAWKWPRSGLCIQLHQANAQPSHLNRVGPQPPPHHPCPASWPASLLAAPHYCTALHMGPCAQPPRQKHSVATLGLGLAQAPGATSRMTSASTTTADSSHRRFVSGPGPSLSSWEPLTGSADVSLLLRDEAGVNSCASSPAQQPDGHVPTSLFHSFPVCRGVPPPPRWAHSMVCVGSTLFIYGGIGVSVQGDLWTLDTAAMSWRALSPTCAGPKDQPVKMLGHAAAAAAVRTCGVPCVHGPCAAAIAVEGRRRSSTRRRLHEAQGRPQPPGMQDSGS